MYKQFDVAPDWAREDAPAPDHPVLATEEDQLVAKLREAESQAARLVERVNYWRERAEAQQRDGWRVVKLEQFYVVPDDESAGVQDPVYRIVGERTW